MQIQELKYLFSYYFDAIQIHHNYVYNSINHRWRYTGDAESKKSGCNLCRSIPQKGHKGFDTSSTEDSTKDLKSSGCLGILKKDSRASLEVHL